MKITKQNYNEQIHNVVPAIINDYIKSFKEASPETQEIYVVSGSYTLLENIVTKYEIPDCIYTDFATVDYIQTVFNKACKQELEDALNRLYPDNDDHPQLRNLRDKLLMYKNENSFVNSLFILCDNLLDAGNDEISYSDDNIGISVKNNLIDIVDLSDTDNSKTIATIKIEFAGDENEETSL